MEKNHSNIWAHQASLTVIFSVCFPGNAKLSSVPLLTSYINKPKTPLLHSVNVFSLYWFQQFDFYSQHPSATSQDNFWKCHFLQKIKGKEKFPVFYLLSVKFGLFSKEKSLYPKVILCLCHPGPLYTVFYECNNVQGKNLNN